MSTSKRSVLGRALHAMWGATVLVCVAVASLAGQTVILDEGEFVLEVDGRPVGSESFTLRRSGIGANGRVIAQSTLELEVDGAGSSVRAALIATGSRLTVRGYDLTISGAEELRLTMEAQPGEDRFRAELSTPEGVREREFRASVGTASVVVLDRNLPHQYYFLGALLRNGPTAVSVIRPLDLSQDDARLESAGLETVRIAGSPIQAQRLRLDIEGTEHRVWLDIQNRVLRVEIPSLRFRAVRREAPAS